MDPSVASCPVRPPGRCMPSTTCGCWVWALGNEWASALGAWDGRSLNKWRASESWTSRPPSCVSVSQTRLLLDKLPTTDAPAAANRSNHGHCGLPSPYATDCLLNRRKRPKPLLQFPSRDRVFGRAPAAPRDVRVADAAPRCTCHRRRTNHTYHYSPLPEPP